MKGERVFVSGGAGVIGHEIVPRLLARGAQVFVGDIKPRPTEWAFHRAFQYRQGDLNTITQEELLRFAPTIFIHLAATFERSTETYGFWEENFWHNVRLSHHLMTLHKGMPALKRVVFASSYLIYEPSLYQFELPQEHAVMLKESAPILPRNLTGMAKLAHEIELRFLDGFCNEAFSSVCARIYRGYGRRSRDIISRWVRMALAGETLQVFRPEGQFDYIYAADTAEGLIRLAEHTAVTGIINLGTGKARRVSDVLSVLKRHFPSLKIATEASNIPFESSCADMTLFQQKIGWVPEHGIEQAIPEIIAYEKAAHLPEQCTHRRLRNILVSSASRKIPLINSLLQAARAFHPNTRVIAGDANPQAPAQYVADGFLHLPPTKAEHVEALLQLCLAEEIDLIIPTRDGELAFWAEHAPYFQQSGVHVVVSAPEAIRLCVDKLAFAEYGQQNGFPVIPAWGAPQGAGPFVVKERYGAGSRAIGINLDQKDAIAHAQSLQAPIFQPFVEGVEISVDAWIGRSHRVKGLVLRTRDQVLHGESTITTTFRDAELEAICQRFLESLPLRGPIVLQLIRDAQGCAHIIELNARFGGASTASIAMGLDIWYWSLLEAAGASIDNVPFIRSAQERRQIRVPMDIHIEAPSA